MTMMLIVIIIAIVIIIISIGIIIRLTIAVIMRQTYRLAVARRQLNAALFWQTFNRVFLYTHRWIAKQNAEV